MTWVLTSGVLQVLALWLGLSAAFFLARSPFGEKTSLKDMDNEEFWRGTQECTRRYRAQVNAAVGLAVLAVSVGLQGLSVLTWASANPSGLVWLAAVAFAAVIHVALLSVVSVLMRRKAVALETEAEAAAAAHRRRFGTPEEGTHGT